MTRPMRASPVLLIAAVALLWGGASGSWAFADEDPPEFPLRKPLRNPRFVPKSSLPVDESFDEVEIFFEENNTDGDLGVQFFLDGDAWRKVIVARPDGRALVHVDVKGNARVVGLTELFSESAEPSFDDLPREDFLDLFPEGTYRFFGMTIAGEWLSGEAELTHDLPDAPVIVSPEEDAEVDPDEALEVEWELVPDPEGSAIVAYQVVVEKDEDDERLRVFSADMLPTDTAVTVPPEFFEADREYKVEILAIEASGNKTITEVPFATEE